MGDCWCLRFEEHMPSLLKGEVISLTDRHLGSLEGGNGVPVLQGCGRGGGDVLGPVDEGEGRGRWGRA